MKKVTMLEKGKPCENKGRKANRSKGPSYDGWAACQIESGGYMSAKAKVEELDLEWLQLISEALEAGLSLEEIRAFLNNPKNQECCNISNE